MGLPAFFWPVATKPDSDAMVRLGRVCHWAGLLLGAPFLLFLGFIFDTSAYPNQGAALLALLSLIPAQIGRGLRYILAGE